MTVAAWLVAMALGVLGTQLGRLVRPAPVVVPVTIDGRRTPRHVRPVRRW